MARRVVAPPITRERAQQAAALLQHDAQHHPSMQRALGKAAARLQNLPWCYRQDAGALIIPSASTPGRWYHVTLAGCECRAAREDRLCWHFAAWLILYLADARGRSAVARAAARASWKHSGGDPDQHVA
jgi:hypothetical protein